MSDNHFNFFKELKRRRVYKVATVYAITSWIVIQIAVATFPYLHMPDWMVTAVIILVVMGFPVAMVLAWAFEMSPNGIIRTTSPGAKDNPLPVHKRKPFTGKITIISLVVLLIMQFAYFRFFYDHGAEKNSGAVAASLLPQKSIAVLPFKNLSDDKDNVYFSDGVMEAILNNLSRINDLKVVSRTSVEQYRDVKRPIREIASELEVANVLEGSVQKMGKNVRITVQLISAEKDEHIWAAHYDRDISDLFTVQSEIARTIAENLKVILTSEEREIIENAPTANLKAYDLYLKTTGSELTTRSEIEEAIKNLREVIEMDKSFAWPYDFLGYYLYRLKNFGVPKNIWADSALILLNTSIALDPSNPYPYLNKAHIYHDLFDPVKQKENLVLGLKYDPNNSFLSYDLGNYYLQSGNYDMGTDLLLKTLSVNKVEINNQDYFTWLGWAFWLIDSDLAIKNLKEAVHNSPESSFLMESLCWVFLFNSDFEETISYADKLQVESDKTPYYFYKAYGYFYLKNYKKAEEYFLKGKALFEENDSINSYTHLQRLAYTQIQLGKTEEGKKNLARFRDMMLNNIRNKEMTGGIVVPGYYDLATIAAYENKKEEAYDYLEKSWDNMERGPFFMFFIMHDPFWDNIRDDARFKSIVEKYQDEENLKKELLKTKLAAYHDRNELKWIEIEK